MPTVFADPTPTALHGATITKIACFGEVLLRLSALPGEQLLQTGQFAVHVGGAEANVAVSLSRLGISSSMVSVLPNNPLGLAARDELRKYGVDTAGCSLRRAEWVSIS
jgi:2-dehydro-3-deoxygluconokinase